MSVYKSIAKNFAANGVGLGIRFLSQIAMVPLFISLWGITKYADWILITAFSSFFAMADMGLNTVTTNEFVIRYQQRDYFTCLKLLTNSFLFIASVGIFFIALAIGFSFLFGFKEFLNVTVFSESETSMVFILLLSQIFIRMYSGAYNSIFKATAHTHIVIMIENFIRLAELLILFFGILFRMNILLMVFIYVIPVCVGILIKHSYSRKWFKLKFSIRLFDAQLLKSFIKPSFAFMFIPLGHAVSNQGMIFVVNAILGPVILVAYTTTRTLVNFLRSLTNVLAGAIWPEVSAAYGRKDFVTMKNMYARALILTFWMTVLCIIVLCFIGKPVYLWWTKNAVVFESFFFYGMLAFLLIICLWGIASVIPSATNNHIRFSFAFLFSQIIGVSLTYISLLFYPHLGIIPIILIIVELFLLWFVLKESNRIVKSNFNDFRKTIKNETVFLIKNIKKLGL